MHHPHQKMHLLIKIKRYEISKIILLQQTDTRWSLTRITNLFTNNCGFQKHVALEIDRCSEIEKQKVVKNIT